MSVVRIWQLASCWHLLQSPNSCCWRCPKRWKSQGARLGLYGRWSITSQPQQSNQSQSQLVVLYGAQWHFFGPLKHLAGKRFATDTNMKLSPPGYRLVATVKVWCVHRSHNKVLLTRVLVHNLIFCKFLVTWPTRRLEWLMQKHPSKNKTHWIHNVCYHSPSMAYSDLPILGFHI